MNVSLIFSLCDLWKLFMEQFVKAIRMDDNSSHIIHDVLRVKFVDNSIFHIMWQWYV